jgi:hypothetical protein
MGIASVILVGVCLLLGAGYAVTQARLTRLQREAYIRMYVFPASLLATLGNRHPHLVEKDYFLVARALREFFLIRARAGQNTVAMPSRVVDDLWHEFILHTRDYASFCTAAFGGFFHHIPASATPKSAEMNHALRRTWRHACLEENINPNNPTRLPLLFAIDEKLGIAGGYKYQPRRNAGENSDSSCGGVACGGQGRNAEHGSHDSGADGTDGGCGGGCGGD